MLVQSLNSPFFPPRKGAELGRANLVPRALVTLVDGKGGSGNERVQDNLHAHAQNEPIKNH